jgi:hypothetical protein
MFGARERDGQELLVLHKEGHEAAALGSVGADGIAAPHGKGRARCAAVVPEPEGRLHDSLASFSTQKGVKR